MQVKQKGNYENNGAINTHPGAIQTRALMPTRGQHAQLPAAALQLLRVMKPHLLGSDLLAVHPLCLPHVMTPAGQNSTHDEKDLKLL